MSDIHDHKRQLFDLQCVCELVTASIILFLTEVRHEDSETLDEDQVADFVVENFPSIVNSITGESDKATDEHDPG
jgi:hypothetical protein